MARSGASMIISGMSRPDGQNMDSEKPKLISICQTPLEKIFRFTEMANYSRVVAILTRQEGRYANVSNAGQVAVDVGGFLDD
jgi:hypothetical protein